VAGDAANILLVLNSTVVYPRLSIYLPPSSHPNQVQQTSTSKDFSCVLVVRLRLKLSPTISRTISNPVSAAV